MFPMGAKDIILMALFTSVSSGFKIDVDALPQIRIPYLR